MPGSTAAVRGEELGEKAATWKPGALELTDPLAEFLGSLPAEGFFRYTYEDAVKLCGHSCPTVASAWRMVEVALRTLYSQERPVRGQIEVTVGGNVADGSVGPPSQVFGLVTGAADDVGFRGLMGLWPRNGLLRFNESLGKYVRFRRLDTGAAVEVAFSPLISGEPRDMRKLVLSALRGDSTGEDRARFREAWRDGVQRILQADASEIVQLQIVEGRELEAHG